MCFRALLGPLISRSQLATWKPRSQRSTRFRRWRLPPHTHMHVYQVVAAEIVPHPVACWLRVGQAVS